MSGAPVVVAGEALVDLVPGPDGRLDAHAGGGPFNTARAIARLDRPVRFLGALSDDRYGARLRAALEADGVGLELVLESACPTTLALAELDAAGSAIYRFYAAGTSAPDVPVDAALARVREPPAMLHVGGLGLVLEPMATALEAAVGAVAGRTLVMLDPNCRPSLIADAGAYRGRLRRMLAGTDVVKASVDDLAWLAPGVAAHDAARGLLELGPAVALITAGPAGATVVTSGAERLVPAEPVAVVDTIGAGDAFGGGFLARWHERGLGTRELTDLDAVTEAARFAALVAGRTCERAGAVPPRLAEVAAAPEES